MNIVENALGKTTATMADTRLIMILVVVLGVLARFAVATQGHNYDLDSYLVVADIVKRGGSVYAETSRYNYGPVWFHLVSWLRLATSWFPGIDPDLAFRYGLTCLLTAVDLCVFLILRRRYSGLAATLFLLNPVSVIITGYHCQFDNLAILLGLAAMLLLGDEMEVPLRRTTAPLTLLGLSLATKHLLFLFPLWLAVKQRRAARKLWCLCLPTLVFLLGFAPYWAKGHQGIIKNVFLYTSLKNVIFYDLFVPQFFQFVFSAKMVWIMALVISAFVFRKQKPFESLLLYCAILVTCSPAIVNQYLVIVVPFIAVFPNVFFALYTAVATWFLLGDYYGLNIAAVREVVALDKHSYYALLILFMCSGLAWELCQTRLLAFRKLVYREILGQFGREPEE